MTDALYTDTKLITGNAYDADTRGTGWFIGFSDWTRRPRSDLLHVPQDAALSGLCVKWFDHPDGHASRSDKQISTGRTMSMLVTTDSYFELDFSEACDFPPGRTRTLVFERAGDFAAWGAGFYHRWRCTRRSTILTVRWNQEGDAA
jgi:hypothetical protein